MTSQEFARGGDRVFIRVITSPSGRHAQKGRSEPFLSIPSVLPRACPHLPTSAHPFSLSYWQTEAALACERYSLLIIMSIKGCQWGSKYSILTLSLTTHGAFICFLSPFSLSRRRHRNGELLPDPKGCKSGLTHQNVANLPNNPRGIGIP